LTAIAEKPYLPRRDVGSKMTRSTGKDQSCWPLCARPDSAFRAPSSLSQRGIDRVCHLGRMQQSPTRRLRDILNDHHPMLTFKRLPSFGRRQAGPKFRMKALKGEPTSNHKDRRLSSGSGSRHGCRNGIEKSTRSIGGRRDSSSKLAPAPARPTGPLHFDLILGVICSSV
jgi:hypothetical protein